MKYLKSSFLLLIPGIMIFSSIALSQELLNYNISFRDSTNNHNMHITADENFYYTVNGGSASSGMINQFDLSGNYIKTYKIPLDFRSIFYNASDGFLYVGTYSRSVVRIDNLDSLKYTTILTNAYENVQSGIAVTPDGNYYFAMNGGTVKKYDFHEGTVLDTLLNLNAGNSVATGQCAVAADAENLYTLNGSDSTISVYNFEGEFVKSYKVTDGVFGFSLSYANGKLFTATDGNYSTNGMWYGYQINSSVSVKESPYVVEKNFNLQKNYPNPFNPQTKIEINIERPQFITVTVYDINGKLINELYNGYRNKGNLEFEFSGKGLTSGTYFCIVRGEQTSKTISMTLIK